MRIAWGITGAGHLLSDSVKILVELSKKHDVTVLLSEAGEEVLKMYGLFEAVKKVTGGYYRELVQEREQRSSFPITGRFTMEKYDALVVSPATANTVSKIVNGIADTLVTNAVAMAGKGRVKTYIVPGDMEPGELETVLPYKLELDLCQKCEICQAAAACPNDAIIPALEIDLLRCRGCGTCAAACPYSAIIGGKKLKIYIREIDAQNSKRLSEIEGIKTINHPSNLKDKLM